MSRAIQNGILIFTSPSAITKFDPGQYGGCKRRWAWRYVFGKEEPQPAAAKLGDEEHKKIEHYERTGEDVLSPISRAGKRHVDFVREKLQGGYAAIELDMGDRVKLEDVPVRGRLDVLNWSGEHLGEEGPIRDGIVEANDWKTCGNPQNMKSGAELPDTVQMALYGIYALEDHRDQVRLSHTYFGTQSRWSEKRSVVVPVERLYRRREEISATVREMKDVARVKDALEAEPNWDACDAWRGCPYRELCTDREPRAARSFFTASRSARIAEAMKEENMDFLESLMGGPTPAAAPTPPASPSPKSDALRAQMAALQAQIEAEEAAARAPKTTAPQPNVMLTGDDAKRYAKATGEDVPPGAGIQTSHAAAMAAGILPRDVPKPGATGPTAEPIPQEQLAAMPPAIQAKVLEAPPAPISEPKRGRGRPRKTPAEPTSVTTTAPVTVAPERPEGLELYVDVRQVRGLDTEPLEAYIERLTSVLCEELKLEDLLSAPNEHIAAFGKWRGVLKAAVKRSPPSPGAYTLHGIALSEIKATVLEALEPLCAVLVRG